MCKAMSDKRNVQIWAEKKNLKDSKQILKKNYIVDGQALNQGIPKIVFFFPPPLPN